MTTTLRRPTWVGTSVERLEDGPLVTGKGLFAADINFARQLHMRIVRSERAHATLTAIHTAEAAALPGVVAVWTARDIEDLPPIEFREGPQPKLAPFRQYVLARERVRYVGEPVAAVFAEDAYVAEDAAELVNVEMEDLPVLLDAASTPAEFASGLSTEATVCKQEYGDIERAFDQSVHTVELDLAIGRHSGVPLETRGALGRYDAARDVLELHGAAKVPHKNRESLAKMFGRSLASVHVFESHVGGGFGVRGELYPEDILVLVAAMRLGRPVKWIEDRREHMVAANQSRQQRHDIRAAFDAGGRLLGLNDTFYHDQGAYLRTHGTRVADLTSAILPGPYVVPAYRAYGHCRLTNKTPTATYRAPGRYEANFARERVMDAAASRLGLSRVEIRRRNLIAAHEMPYHRPVSTLGDEVVYDSGDYELLLNKALAFARWEDLERETAARRKRGECAGVGLAMFVEKSGLGPTDGVRISIDTAGFVEVITGGASVGQGFETVIAQVCADVLGVDYRSVRVVHGRTDRIDTGVGAHASRATVLTANAAAVAAEKVRSKALRLAAQLLETDAVRLTIVDGNVVPKDGAPQQGISLGEIAHRLRPSAGAWGGEEPTLAAEGWFTTPHMTYPYGVQIAVVHVDPQTGVVRVEKAFIAYDIGRAINPRLVRGQLVGGFVQGLGGALFEEFRYDASGQPLSVTFADYLMPSLSDVPEVEVLLTEDAPSPLNPLGIKGAGEGGISPVGALIASAVDDALGSPGLITELPVTPQRLKALIDARPRERVA